MAEPRRIIGTAEIARMFGISSVRADQLQRRHKTFPKPVAKIAAGRIYDYDEVLAWAESTGRELKQRIYE